MFPVLLRIGSFELTTFGLMMFIAFITGGWVATRQFRIYGLREELVSTALMYAAIGGIVGAKVYYAVLARDWHLLFDRAGLVWYGGLLGGWIAVSLYFIHERVDYFTAADGMAPGLAIGYALGRIGCFLVGDDYGRPTNSWVGIAFPKGSPPTTAESLRQFGVHVDASIPADQVLRVHPTQLYEAAAGLIIFGILLAAARRAHPRGRIIGLFCILLGVERFLVEIVRAKDDRLLGPFTIAQLISVLLIITGTFFVSRRGRLIQATAAPPA